jgi:hypothetical protein
MYPAQLHQLVRAILVLPIVIGSADTAGSL